MRVLIPVNDQTPTQPILDRCRRFADAGRCTIVLVHVSPAGKPPGEQPMREYLADAAQALREAGVSAMYVVRDGEPQVEIPRLAQEMDAHLLLPA